MRLGRRTLVLAAVVAAAAAAPARAAEEPPPVPGARAAIVVDGRDGNQCQRRQQASNPWSSVIVHLVPYPSAAPLRIGGKPRLRGRLGGSARLR